MCYIHDINVFRSTHLEIQKTEKSDSQRGSQLAHPTIEQDDTKNPT